MAGMQAILVWNGAAEWRHAGNRVRAGARSALD
jgi:hypothetical protein